MQKVTNIFKKSRLHGSNRLLSYSLRKAKRSKWYKVQRKRVYFKALTNSKRMSSITSVTRRYVRLRGLARSYIHNRLYWQSIYPEINVKQIRLTRNYDLRDRCINGESLLWKIESRLDVVLWRSGITSSIKIGKAVVKAGNVELYNNGVWEVAKRGDQRLKPSIVLKLINWDKLSSDMLTKWSDRVYRSKVPSYRLVNYDLGLISMKHLPKDGEVIIPSNLPIRIESLIRRG